MASKNKRKIEQHTTVTGHAATIEQKDTPWLLVPCKFIVRIFCKQEAGKVLHSKRTNCQPSALQAIQSWSPE